jgi:hypothetical protein
MGKKARHLTAKNDMGGEKRHFQCEQVARPCSVEKE